MLEGWDKKNSYDKWWLSKDMLNMGRLFEVSAEYCRKFYHIDEQQFEHFDRLKFAEDLMYSNIRYEMEKGHPTLLSQAPADSFKKYIDVDLDGDYLRYCNAEETQVFIKNQMYWVGSMYAYCHYHADMLSRDLIKKMPLNYMLEQYHLGHEMGYSVFYDKVKRRWA